MPMSVIRAQSTSLFRLGDQRVGERHAGSAATDDEIICLQGVIGHKSPHF
jgi:hypothetical protein